MCSYSSSIEYHALSCHGISASEKKNAHDKLKIAASQLYPPCELEPQVLSIAYYEDSTTVTQESVIWPVTAPRI